MKKTVGLFASVVLMALAGQASAVNVGQKIYDRAFGRGCGACHDIASNPQLRELIKSGDLPLDKFSEVIKQGRNGMPKAVDAIMAVGPVKKAGLSEDEAIEAVYKYLSE